MSPFLIILVSVVLRINAEQQEFVVGDGYNTGMHGEMFMVETAHKEIKIDSLDFRFNGGGSSQYTFEVWYKQGPFLDYRLDKSYWTQACAGSTVADRYDSANRQWIGATTGHCPILMQSGTKYSIYIAGISRGIVATKICINSCPSYSYEDEIASDQYLTAYMGLALHSSGDSITFGNGYGDSFYIEPDVTIYYTVDATPSPTHHPTTAAPSQAPTVAMCCVSRKGTAIWSNICGAMNDAKPCKMIYDKKGNKKCEYIACGTMSPPEVEEEEAQEMVVLNNIYRGFGINGNEYHWMYLLYAFLGSVATVLVVYMYKICKQTKGLSDNSPLLANNSI